MLNTMDILHSGLGYTALTKKESLDRHTQVLLIWITRIIFYNIWLQNISFKIFIMVHAVEKFCICTVHE